jgi:hypothetical protein
MASFAFDPIDDIKSNPISYIRAELESGTNADNILNELLQQIENIDEFRTALCDGDKCIHFYENIAPFAEDRSKMTELFRLDHKITLICKEECDLDGVKRFYNTLFDKNTEYTDKINANTNADAAAKSILDSLDILMAGMTLGGGKRKKQTGGGVAEIAQLLAGVDAIVFNLFSRAGYDSSGLVERIIALLEKAAIAISGFPDCMREIVGDTLYRLVERFSTSMLGYKFVELLWANKGRILKLVLTLVSHVPTVAGGTMALTVGFVATKVIVRLGNEVSVVNYEDRIKAVLNTLDAATVEDIAKVGVSTTDLTKKFIGLSVELVIKIRQQLADAHDENARKTVIAKANEKADMERDWAALLSQTGLQNLRVQRDDAVKLTAMFNEKFAAIQDAIRMSPEYIAAAALEAARTERDIQAANELAEAMARDLAEARAGDDPQAKRRRGPGAGAAMMTPDAGAESEDGAGAESEDGAGAETEDGAGAETEDGAGEKENPGAGVMGAKRTRGDQWDSFGGKRKSQKQQRQKKQKKTQKQSQKKLSKSKRAKKAKQSKKANKKH